jgi:hypothetical protein
MGAGATSAPASYAGCREHALRRLLGVMACFVAAYVEIAVHGDTSPRPAHATAR